MATISVCNSERHWYRVSERSRLPEPPKKIRHFVRYLEIFANDAALHDDTGLVRSNYRMINVSSCLEAMLLD